MFSKLTDNLNIELPNIRPENAVIRVVIIYSQNICDPREGNDFILSSTKYVSMKMRSICEHEELFASCKYKNKIVSEQFPKPTESKSKTYTHQCVFLIPQI